MKAVAHITLKHGVLDPQGKATLVALEHLGFSGVKAVRIGKYIEIDLNAATPAEAETQARAMCERLLANTVVENFRVEIAAHAL
jgi:phosphoribosylformylglycinamidine synthase